MGVLRRSRVRGSGAVLRQARWRNGYHATTEITADGDAYSCGVLVRWGGAVHRKPYHLLSPGGTDAHAYAYSNRLSNAYLHADADHAAISNGYPAANENSHAATHTHGHTEPCANHSANCYPHRNTSHLRAPLSVGSVSRRGISDRRLSVRRRSLFAWNLLLHHPRQRVLLLWPLALWIDGG